MEMGASNKNGTNIKCSIKKKPYAYPNKAKEYLRGFLFKKLYGKRFPNSHILTKC